MFKNEKEYDDKKPPYFAMLGNIAAYFTFSLYTAHLLITLFT